MLTRVLFRLLYCRACTVLCSPYSQGRIQEFTKGGPEGRRQVKNSGLDTHGERGEREPTTGVWGQCSQRGPGAEPLVRGSGGEVPLKLKTF